MTKSSPGAEDLQHMVQDGGTFPACMLHTPPSSLYSLSLWLSSPMMGAYIGKKRHF